MKTRFLLSTFAILIAGWFSANAQDKALKFNANKKFKIVQFTDIHWVPDNPASEEAAERMNEVLDEEKPDFVIYTGDISTGEPAAEAYKRALKPAVERHISFAVTFGNHDDEHDLTRQQIYDAIKSIPGNMTGTVPGISGVTNFILPVKSSKGDKDAFIIYSFDSHSYSPLKDLKGYDWIKPDQIDWYRKNSKEYITKNGGQPLPAIAFFHIPFPEYNYAAADPGAFMVGTRKETPCSPPVNSGLFSAMLNQRDVMATFVGHDHINDYVVNYKGILLGYGRFTGGETTYHDIPGGNGARVIELTEGEHSLKTWVRLKGGQIINIVDFPADIKSE